MQYTQREWKIAYSSKKVNIEKEKERYISEYFELLKLVARYIPRSSFILEGGGGYGIWCILFAKYLGTQSVNLDIIVEPLKQLNSYLKCSGLNNTITCVIGDIRQLPFRESVFDVYTSFGVIEHLRKWEDVTLTLSESSRVLKEGSIAFYAIPSFSIMFKSKLMRTFTLGKFGLYHTPMTSSALINYLSQIRHLKLIEKGFVGLNFRKMIFHLTDAFYQGNIIKSLIDTLWLMYFTAWRIINLLMKSYLKKII
jgi:ubiquinone/menaquinone biosynthesis C-methylase UbiE